MILAVASFALPLALWCAVSYLPFLWHPLVEITEPGSVPFFQKGTLVEKSAFAAENKKALEAGAPVAEGLPANPVFLPAPDRVALALYRSFTPPPDAAGKNGFTLNQ